MDTRKKYLSKTHRNSKEDTSSIFFVVKCCLCGLLISLAAAIVVISLTALFSLTKPDPEKSLLIVSSVLSYPCAMLGGFVSYRLFKGNIALCAAIFCFMNVILALLMYPLLPSTTGDMSAVKFWGLRCLMIACGVMGCFMGSKSFQSGKRRRRRR
ncbi:MAG: hypothetical protein E7667_00370 [Ruminococcaceae bacterium]|nr:hypothetical protein [Oscillospiraceae bacterium]